MKKPEITNEPLHKTPANLEQILNSDPKLLEKWNKLTPLAQNEWICWITMPKKEETKEKRLNRLQEDLLKGKRRPCCWPGCPHRRPKAAKWFK